MALLLSLSAVCFAEAEKGIVARWDFTKGNGTVLHDSGGNDNHGEIHGAEWVKRGKGHALKFDGVDDYVDCGAGPSLDLTGSITLEAWVHPLALPPGREPGILGKFFTSYALTLHRNGTCHFYISSGGNYCRTPTEVGAWHHVAATFDGTMLKLYRNGPEEAFRESKIGTIRGGKNLLMGCIVGNPGASDRAFRDTTYFNGMLDDVRIYDRALSADEIRVHYKRNAGDYGMDTTWFDKLRLTPFYYFGQRKVLLDVDFAGCLPLSDKAHLQVALRRAGQQDPLQQHRIKDLPKSGRTLDIPFKTADFTPGTYELHALLENNTGTRAEAKLSFDYPPPAMKVASPREKVVAALSPPAALVPYEVDLHAGGGFSIAVGGDSYPVESTYSYPHGGENGLLAGDAPAGNAEPTWRVTTKRSTPLPTGSTQAASITPSIA